MIFCFILQEKFCRSRNRRSDDATIQSERQFLRKKMHGSSFTNGIIPQLYGGVINPFPSFVIFVIFHNVYVFNMCSYVSVGKDFNSCNGGIVPQCGDMMTSSNGNISALLAICAGNSPVPGEFPTQRPVTRSFDVFFDLRPNKRLSKTIVRLVIWDAIALIITS